MKERILSINPECNVSVHNIFLDKDSISILGKYQIDYIVDACDSVQAKKLLIDYSLDKDIKLISSMGTANKIDPNKLSITDIRKTSYDPLAKILRKYVKDNKINSKINVLSSTELPIKTGDRTPGSTSFVPSSAGLLIASYIIRYFINK
jgi:tRNA A37 threonylcarbamoyladenosine dehydratase